MTFGEAAESHLRDLDNNVKLKPRTPACYRERLRALEKSWPNLSTTEIRRISPGDCKTWAGKYGRIAAPSNYNNTVALLRHVFAVAVEAGVIYSNPAAVLKRAALRRKEIALPTSEKFNAMVAEMRNGHGPSRVIALILWKGWPTAGCVRARRTRWSGGIWILRQARLRCAATL